MLFFRRKTLGFLRLLIFFCLRISLLFWIFLVRIWQKRIFLIFSKFSDCWINDKTISQSITNFKTMYWPLILFNSLLHFWESFNLNQSFPIWYEVKRWTLNNRVKSTFTINAFHFIEFVFLKLKIYKIIKYTSNLSLSLLNFSKSSGNFSKT